LGAWKALGAWSFGQPNGGQRLAAAPNAPRVKSKRDSGRGDNKTPPHSLDTLFIYFRGAPRGGPRGSASPVEMGAPLRGGNLARGAPSFAARARILKNSPQRRPEIRIGRRKTEKLSPPAWRLSESRVCGRRFGSRAAPLLSCGSLNARSFCSSHGAPIFSHFLPPRLPELRHARVQIRPKTLRQSGRDFI